MHNFFLTFDVEDYINPNSTHALSNILEILEKYKIKALFFITGHMAEKIRNFPNIIKMLEKHEIGYHSSSHSVRPTILEYTDLNSYQDAYEISLKRETSHINPLTGEIEGGGGIKCLKEIFPTKQIIAYRAPGCSWSAPHLEALRDLGIKFDFSSIFSHNPFYYKGITFYPYYPQLGEWQGNITQYIIVIRSILTLQHTIMDMHPNHLVNQNMWDFIYYHGNPDKQNQAKQRNSKSITSLFKSFEFLLRQLCAFQKIRLIKISTDLVTSHKTISQEEIDFKKAYEHSIYWVKTYFNYEPKFIYNHFMKFFNLS